eukprot:scaffold57369_cov17-Tisochrysis_lutea.AAC.2
MALSKHVEDGQGLNHLLLFLPLCLLSCTCEAWGRNGVKKQAFSVHVFSCVAGVNTTKSRCFRTLFGSRDSDTDCQADVLLICHDEGYDRVFLCLRESVA